MRKVEYTLDPDNYLLHNNFKTGCYRHKELCGAHCAAFEIEYGKHRNELAPASTFTRFASGSNFRLSKSKETYTQITLHCLNREIMIREEE